MLKNTPLQREIKATFKKMDMKILRNIEKERRRQN
jgi:hypothetical protein